MPRVSPHLIRKPLISPPAIKHTQQHIIYGKNKKARTVLTYKEKNDADPTEKRVQIKH